MRIVHVALVALVLAGCSKTEKTTQTSNETVTENSVVMANESAGAEANGATAAANPMAETSYEYTMNGKAIKELIDANGNYVDWSGKEHVDHGTAAMINGKACFTSAMSKKGQECWTPEKDAKVGESFVTTSDKGEKLTVKRVAYEPAPK